MKKLCCYLEGLLIIIITISSCKKMDHNYGKFIVPGGIIYPEAASDPVAYSGHNRVKITWFKGFDPSVVKAWIYWNNYTDSTEVDFSKANKDTVSVIIDSLVEKPYTFIIKTYDAEGHVSVPVEVLSAAYGDRYQASLVNRPVISSIRGSNDTVVIQWGSAAISNGAYATDVKYTDTAGEIHIQRFGINQSNTAITGYKPGSIFQYRTVYLPDTLSVDTFYTDYLTQHVSAKIDKSNWIATADSYTPTRLLPNGGPPEKAIDDDINTYWHTLYPSNVNYPHWLEVNMQQVVTVTIVELTYRQNVFNGFTDFMIQGSLDGINWTTYGTFNFKTINTPQRFPIPGSPKIQYLRIYATKGHNQYAHLGELSVYGY